MLVCCGVAPAYSILPIKSRRFFCRATGIVEAERDEIVHAQLAHVAERHRWAEWVVELPFFSLTDMEFQTVQLRLEMRFDMPQHNPLQNDVLLTYRLTGQ
jgi:hypothetical protein